MSNKPTICVDCKHYARHAPAAVVVHECTFGSKEGKMNYVTGKPYRGIPMSAAAKNDHGDCIDFEAKEEEGEWAAPDVKGDYLVRSDDPDDYCNKCDYPTERSFFFKRVLGCINWDCENYYHKKKEVKS